MNLPISFPFLLVPLERGKFYGDRLRLILSLPNLAKSKFQPNVPIEKQIAPCVRTGRELSFEWSHHRISSADSKGRVTSQNSIKHWQ